MGRHVRDLAFTLSLPSSRSSVWPLIHLVTLLLSLPLFLSPVSSVKVAASRAVPAGRYPMNRKWQLYGYDMSDDQSKCQFGPGWTNLMGGCYLITQKGVSWNDAAEVCRSLDPKAEFGTLWTTADMDFVSRMARSRGLTNVYLNGKYEAQSLDYRWHLKRPVVTSYTSWTDGQPKEKAVGHAITLHVSAKDSTPGTLSTASIATSLPALCKRPAKGFRRRSAREIQQYISRLSKGPDGWSLVKGQRGSSGESGSRSNGGSGRRDGGSAVAGGSGDGRSRGASSVGGLPPGGLGSSSPSAAVSNSTFKPRSLPPPISKNRNYLQKPGHFEPVLPVSSPKHKDSRNLEVSAIEPVDVVDMVKVREDKLNEMFGRSALRLKDAMTYYPEDYRYPVTDYQRMAHVLTTELLAQDQREHKTDAPFEVAKVLTSRLFAEGKAIQCFFGEMEEAIANRQVECVATAGVIDACVKQVLLSGKIIRGCGLPGTDHNTKKHGCAKSTNGEICYCDHDNCNAAPRNLSLSYSLLFFFLVGTAAWRKLLDCC